uniref:RxLR effector candidate protein n=1 Tax=Hyaloperonospora arabidopsidis (strain Emoy2) TaxID=559515 RepID=A0A090C2T5_HYAAE|nr:RxLR effector candidate protein [Hyaloperonospora arabidopsidis Emoy2]
MERPQACGCTASACDGLTCAPEPKRFLRDLRSGKAKQICILITEDEYVTDILSATILMRERDIPYTAVSTPSGMLWEWLVMPQGLSNAPATFNRCVTNLLRPVRDFAPSYFDDVFVHSQAMNRKTDEEVHRRHVRQVLTLMRNHKLYADLKKYIFAASEIPLLGYIVDKQAIRPDPETIKTITNWPVPVDVKEL